MGNKRSAGMGLADEWRLWVVENLIAGVTEQRVVRTLVDDGVPMAIARREVRGILRSPTLDACRRLLRRCHQRELTLRLQQTLSDGRPGELVVARDLAEIGAERFFDEFWRGNRPLKLSHAASDWPALSRWQPERLAERFGDEDIEVEVARDEAPNHEGRYVTRKLGAFIDQLLTLDQSNDLYCVARNKNADRLEGLFSDIVVDETIFDPARLRGGTSLWIGPKGTLTPLHHDTTNILFHQIVGDKRFWLIPPTEAALLDHLDGFYCRADPQTLDVAATEVTLSPGQALFIPVGWYHRVEALSVSVSFSLLNFRRDNDFSWYAPGSA